MKETPVSVFTWQWKTEFLEYSNYDLTFKMHVNTGTSSRIFSLGFHPEVKGDYIFSRVVLLAGKTNTTTSPRTIKLSKIEFCSVCPWRKRSTGTWFIRFSIESFVSVIVPQCCVSSWHTRYFGWVQAQREHMVWENLCDIVTKHSNCNALQNASKSFGDKGNDLDFKCQLDVDQGFHIQ